MIRLDLKCDDIAKMSRKTRLTIIANKKYSKYLVIYKMLRKLF